MYHRGLPALLLIWVMLTACRPVRDGMLSPPPATPAGSETPPPTSDVTPGLATDPPPTSTPLTPSPRPPVDDDQDGYDAAPTDGSPADCDDHNSAIHPGAEEPCYAQGDLNCDGVEAPGGTEHTWYQDGDHDNYGQAVDSLKNCEENPPEGYSAQSGDCDDTRDNTYPGAPELCDGRDNDCNPATNELVSPDQDGDGLSECGGDCDDTNVAISPELMDVCDGGVDNDCDLTTSENVDGDGDGFTACEGDCDDRHPAASPAHSWEVVDTLDNDCVEASQEPDTSVNLADYTVVGIGSESLFGGNMLGLGDVDGDGHLDFATGASLYQGEDGGIPGAVVFYYGTGSREMGDHSGLDSVMYSGQLVDAVGSALDGGDIDGDGYPDVVVSAPGVSRVYIWYGHRRVEGRKPSSELGPYFKAPNGTYIALGVSVAVADLNGDGFEDVVAAAPSFGNLLIWFGRANRPDGEISSGYYTLETGINSLGSAMAAPGDLDGDGRDDVVIGAPTSSPVVGTDSRQGAGQVMILWGSDESDYRDHTVERHFVAGQADGDNFGSALAAVGDMDGDGLPDVLVGAYKVGMNGGDLATAEGAHYLLPGNTSRYPSGEVAEHLPLKIAGVVADTGLGSLNNSGGVGDINGDGFPDLAIGLPRYRYQTNEVGMVTVFLGRAEGFSRTLYADEGDANFVGVRVGDGLSSACAAGDMDEDGIDDLLLGAHLGSASNSLGNEGAMYLFYGYPLSR